MHIDDLLTELNTLLEPSCYNDYAPNGLQVAGCTEIHRIVTGVTASQALIDHAVTQQADAILVHHGYFWKQESPVLCGIKQRRIKTLLEHDINLIAYHLPLDAHPTLGNNACLAKQLGFNVTGKIGEQNLLWLGQLTAPKSAKALADHISLRLQRPALLLGPPGKSITNVAWCSGGAQSFFETAIHAGTDAFITGEVSEQNYHMALEYDVCFIAAGHHATERYGIKALGEYLANTYPLQVHFTDLPNPV